MSTVDTADALVLAHLQLVKQEVRHLLRRLPTHVERDELISTGFVALVACARRFTGADDVTFAQVARPRVRGALLDHLRSLDWASRTVRRKARRIESVRNGLASSLGRTPTTAELAESLGVATDDIAASVHAVQQAAVLSLQALAPAATNPHVVERVPSPEEMALQLELVGYLRDAVAALPARLCKVITECFFEERPISETAADLAVTESRVSHLRGEALKLLRDGINAQLEPERVAADQREGCAARRRRAYYATIAAKGDLKSRLVGVGRGSGLAPAAT